MKFALSDVLIHQPPAENLALVVTIPCHDEPDLLRTLASVAACDLSGGRSVELIVVINASERAPESVKRRNAETCRAAQAWAVGNARPDLRFHVFDFPDLPAKHAGVGLARKIAMDEAARRLSAAGNPRGVVACLDADTLVRADYLNAVMDFFARYPVCPAASIYYEHPLSGDDFAPAVYAAIARYELHLRYYVHALRRAGLPTAVQTVGSAMAVRADAYVAQGGMNRRQAGEDFYFLHKFTPLGGFGEIGDTTLVPSPRSSHRVPFGTGKAVGEMLAGESFLTYSPFIFDDLGFFLKDVDNWHNVQPGEEGAAIGRLPESVSGFLRQENFADRLREIRANTAGVAAFRKRFYRWFDAFVAMKFVHFARDHFYPNVAVEAAAAALLQKEGEAGVLLGLFREMDRRTGVLNFV